MRVISNISIFALAATTLSAPAFAQIVEGSFTGPRIEVLGGYDNVQAGDDDSDDAAEGISYGAAIGYDVQLGGAVVGIEGEYSGSSADITGHDIDIAGDSFRLDAGRDLYIGARAGFAVAPSTLVYVKGGYTNFRVDSRYDDAAGTVFEEGVTLDGFRLGAGIEQQFSLLGPSGYVKAEYRYSNYSNLDIADFDAEIDTDRHQLMAGLGVRF